MSRASQEEQPSSARRKRAIDPRVKEEEAQDLSSRIPGEEPPPPSTKGRRGPSDLLMKEEALRDLSSRASVEEPPSTKRRRVSRWSKEKCFVPGMPTVLPADIEDEKRESYLHGPLVRLEVEESGRQLREGTYKKPKTPGSEGSVSPEPIYDTRGVRVNTREVRKRKELEMRRHHAVQSLMKLDPMYRPPTDYRPMRTANFGERVWIPQEDNPHINFIGLLLGPRGTTLKTLEQESGAKIILRGKGSGREAKEFLLKNTERGRDEPLHAYIHAPEKEAVYKAVDKVQLKPTASSEQLKERVSVALQINRIINAAVADPESYSKIIQVQKQQLAMLRGAFRPEEAFGATRCSNCGSADHRSWECAAGPNVTASTICLRCGAAGHVAMDCKSSVEGFADAAQQDPEYAALMDELEAKTAAPAFITPKAEPGEVPQQKPIWDELMGATAFQERLRRAQESQRPIARLDLTYLASRPAPPPPPPLPPPPPPPEDVPDDIERG